MESYKNKIKQELEDITNRLNLEKLTDSLYFPKYFEVETIRACNAKCIMCTVPQWEGKNNHMNDDLFLKIIKEMESYKDWINVVCLSRNGEPLLDKNLVEKIHMLKDIDIKYVSFSTNASLLDEKKSISLIGSGLDDIRFSIDGVKKETFESIRKGLKYEQVINNCLNFIKLRNEMGSKPTIQVRMVLQKSNQDEEKIFHEYWSTKVSEGDIISSKPLHSWGNQLENYNNENIKEYTYLPCISPWSTMIIHFDGKIPLCGCDYNNSIYMGDLNNSTIKDIWTSKRFDEIRNKHSSGKRSEINLCEGCNIWDTNRKKIYNTEGK